MHYGHGFHICIWITEKITKTHLILTFYRFVFCSIFYLALNYPFANLVFIFVLLSVSKATRAEEGSLTTDRTVKKWGGPPPPLGEALNQVVGE